MKTLLIEQMELTIDGKQRLNVVDARASRVQRGRFWFNKMRQIVDLALPPKPSPVPPPEQTYMDLRKPVKIRTVQKPELEHV